MSRGGLPGWMKKGFRRNGPRRLTCRCGAVISSSALAQASHLRGKEHNDWLDREQKADELRRRVTRGGA